MAIREYHVNGKIIKLDDEFDPNDTGIVFPHPDKKKEEIKTEKKDFDNDTIIDVFGEENDK